MVFLRHILIAVLILIAGIVSTLIFPYDDIGHAGFGIGAIVSQLWLFAWAIIIRDKRAARFDMAVASEIIIAFGIFSLIFGIFIAVMSATFRDEYFVQNLSFEAVRPILIAFAWGLFAAGLAPLLATTLRQVEVLKYASSKDGDRISIDDDMDTFKEKLRDVTRTVDKFITAFERSQMVFEKSATSFNRSSDVYESVATKVQKSLDQLGETARAESDRVAAGFSAIAKELKSYQKVLEQSSGHMNTLATEIRSFHAAANESTTLLNGLNKLIESVERFIRPDGR